MLFLGTTYTNNKVKLKNNLKGKGPKGKRMKMKMKMKTKSQITYHIIDRKVCLPAFVSNIFDHHFSFERQFFVFFDFLKIRNGSEMKNEKIEMLILFVLFFFSPLPLDLPPFHLNPLHLPLLKPIVSTSSNIHYPFFFQMPHLSYSISPLRSLS